MPKIQCLSYTFYRINILDKNSNVIRSGVAVVVRVILKLVNGVGLNKCLSTFLKKVQFLERDCVSQGYLVFGCEQLHVFCVILVAYFSFL